MKIGLSSNNIFIARSTYEERDIPKSAGFRWDPIQKIWWTDDPERAIKLSEYCDESAKEAIETMIDVKTESIVASRATDANFEIPVPNGLEYMPFQRAGIAYASIRDITLIGDEMGLGKTIEALGIINAHESIKSVLIICPASLRLNWKMEAEKWIIRDMSIAIIDGNILHDSDIVIINYDILKKHRAALRAREWDLLCVDECHYLKNPKAQRTIEVLGKYHRDPCKRIDPIPSRKRIYMTGTPIVNRPIELYPILRSTNAFEWKSWFKYVTRYCNGYRTQFGWDVSGASHLDELQEKLRAQLMIRRLKKDVLTELPAKRRQVIELPANGAEKAVKTEADAWQLRQDTIAQLQAAVELSKVSDNKEDYKIAVDALREGMRAAFTEMSKIRHNTAIAKIPYVVEHIREVVDNSGKVVLFAHHKDVVSVIQSTLKEYAIKSVILTGDMRMEERKTSIDSFQNDKNIWVFIGTIGAAGVGITLTASSHVIFAELDWVPGNMTQAEDRCHRIGQTESVLVQHLVLEGSLDAEIANRLVEKQDIIDRALDLHNKTELDREWGSLIKIGDVSTGSLTPSEIDEQSKKITPDEIEEIHSKLRFLAERCDGAVSHDDIGFNRYDSPIGMVLAALPELTHRQAILGQRLVEKYKKQLDIFNQDE